MDNLAGQWVDLVGCKVALVALMGILAGHQIDLVGYKVVSVAQKVVPISQKDNLTG